MCPLPLAALREVLLHRRARDAQRAYHAHLTWLVGAQLYALGGGREYPVPDVYAIFPDDALPRDRRCAEDVRQSILARLTHSTRKEHMNG